MASAGDAGRRPACGAGSGRRRGAALCALVLAGLLADATAISVDSGGCLGGKPGANPAMSIGDVAKGLGASIGKGLGRVFGSSAKPDSEPQRVKGGGGYMAASYAPESYGSDPKAAALNGGVTGYTMDLDPNAGPTKHGASRGPTGPGSSASKGPTTKGTVPEVADDSYLQGFLAEEVRPQPPVEEGPLAELMRITQAQERGLLRQAGICRVAVARMANLQRIMLGREGMAGGKSDKEVAGEVEDWKTRTMEMQMQLMSCLATAGARVSDLVNEKSAASFLSVTPMELGPSSESEEEALAPRPASAKRPEPKKMSAKLEGPSVRQSDGSLKPLEKIKTSKDEKQKAVVPPKGPDLQLQVFSQEVEQKYRVGTYHGCPVYGAVLNAEKDAYEYPLDTELHLIWDVDQSKLVGEGTNDVELVIKCVLWWKEELKHDPAFIPRGVSAQIKKEFQVYCENFDLAEAFDSVMHLLLRPGAKDFTVQHPQAKWWTFTNKDREVDGQVVRDVSDDDGLVGMYQANPHEVSGNQVIDANKYALQVLDEIASRHAGIQNQERPIIGVRGKRKDLARVVRLIQNKRKAAGLDEAKPVTVILLDDRFQDAYGNCQANDPRILCHIPAYNAITEDKKAALIEGMNKILPVDTLLKFYNAFKTADKNHALVQCVDIMSDDQSMLMKKKGTKLEDTYFEYAPKVAPLGVVPPPMKQFVGVNVR